MRHTNRSHTNRNWSFTDNVMVVGLSLMVAALSGCWDLEQQAIDEPLQKPSFEQPKDKQNSDQTQKPLALAMADDDGKQLAQVVRSARRADKDKAGTKVSEGPSEQDTADAKIDDESVKLVPGSPLEVTELTFATEVEAREPVDSRAKFSIDDERVYAHLRINSPDADRKVNVVFRRFDREFYRTDLSVGKSPRWRTWASIGATKGNIGSWTVDVEDEQGNLLTTRKFEIVKELQTLEDAELDGEPTE